ncbi:MAG: HAD family hydrolase [Thermomicrobiales bacterium]|nr:HAD family hydrolase [Thermomicrobiales bacterium]
MLFDVDDTLCDYAGARAIRLRRAFAAAFEHAEIAPPRDMAGLIAQAIAIHPHGADHFAALLASHGVSLPEAAHVARVWYQTHRFHGLQLFPDALDTLALVRASGVNRKVGLITNGPAEVQRAKIELLDLLRHVDFALISGEFGVAKPDPAIFREALARAGATPAETLFVGDSPEFDVAGAHASGLRSVWVNRTGQPWSHDGPAPDHEVTDLTSLTPLLHEENR